MSISFKLSLFLGGVMLMSLLISGFFIYRDTGAAIENTIKVGHVSQARQVSFNIDQLLFERRNDIVLLAGFSDIKEFLGEGAIGTNGARLHGTIQEFLITSGFWDAVLVSDASGATVVAVGNPTRIRATEGTDEYRDMVRRARAGETVYSDAFVAAGDREVLFTTPVRSLHNPRKIVGVVSGIFSWPFIGEILNEVRGSEVMIFNSAGDLIARNDFSAGARDISLLRTLAFDVARGGGPVYIKENDRGEEELIAGVTEEGYVQYKGNGWVLVLKTPLSIALAPARITTARLIGLLAATWVLTTVFLLFVVGRVFIRPIRKLTASVSRMSSQNLSAHIPVTTRDELGVLAESFNTMSERLSFAYRDQEAEIEKRTHELADAKKTLEDKVDELERMNKLMVGREIQMVELKDQLKQARRGAWGDAVV